MTELQEIAFDALREMYREAEPPLDFDDVRENPEDYDDNWFQQHTLPKERQNEIVDKHCEKHDLTDRERVSITWEAITDYDPSYHEDDEL